ncbi:LacI family DNA-binding transcriptional regulator [Klebsiella variicola]|uniref:LacI family DNA-binding transcriptional regulator n=1 Tax=Klebsiella variicola TaxID=244366 RepID=UPI000D74E2F2|nr:LacI family DNA-binding transcriptional regulator [Klebsiella variicola]PXL17024.1 LacI family transcriptional regulator [Klebsiella variicola]PXL41679.1 LacI family transcriptional regulator [Klebsiella variicola]PXL62971.1 LacI family transcriptional regulator [Klebsiella variicola]
MDQESEEQDHSEKRLITMRDVASAAGVSVSTVSRILDERLPPSRSASAEKVRQVARELGYRRDYVASSLRRGGTGTIGVLVPRLTDSVTAMLFEEIARAAARRGYFAVVATCGDDPDQERESVESLLDRRVDGLILSTCRLDDPLPQTLRERDIPHVLVLRTDGISLSSVGDDELGGYLATRHLIDLGHKNIGLIGGPDFASNALNRRKGFEKAMREVNLEIQPQWCCSSDFNIQSGEDAGKRILSTTPPPSAIFAVNDEIAIGVVAAAHHQGITIGQELSLVGYNDIPLVSRLPVALTSVRTPLEHIASNAVDMLINGEDRQRLRAVAPTLIPRKSTTSFNN